MIAEIQKNIPIPAPGVLYPWETMEIGDSFVYENGGGYQRTYDANRKYKPKRFACRKYCVNFRIWRIK